MQITDPFFGELQFSKRCTWVGQRYFEPEDTQILVSLIGDKSGPENSSREIFTQLTDLYIRNKSKISNALREFCFRYLRTFEANVLPRHPDDTKGSLTLVSIELGSTTEESQFVYCFAESDDDSLFGINIRSDSEIVVTYLGD